MAEFLGTTATNFRLEELIKNARERLVLISPYLKINTRIRELLADKDRLKIDMRLVYGKSELQPEEIAWMRELRYLRTSFCQNLHAKCYLNEDSAIITSMNLYEFSQINNNEMGILVRRSEDEKLYQDIYEEALRVVRVGEEVRLSAEKVIHDSTAEEEHGEEEHLEKLTTSKLGKKLNVTTSDMEKILLQEGYLIVKEDKLFLSPQGEACGGEWRYNKYKKGGTYFLWPESIIAELNQKGVSAK